jgi:hypothetical protein
MACGAGYGRSSPRHPGSKSAAVAGDRTTIGDIDGWATATRKTKPINQDLNGIDGAGVGSTPIPCRAS